MTARKKKTEDTEYAKASADVEEEQGERDIVEENYRLRQAAGKARKRAASLARQLEESQEYGDRLSVELDLYQQPFEDRPDWLTEVDTSEHHATIVAFLSDTHYGEVVKKGEIGGYNAFNLEIAEQRTQRFFERTIHVARTYVAGVTYDGVVLALGGDLVSGDIHDELVETNEVSTYRAIETCLPWLARGVEMFAEEYGAVHVVSAPGNHPRDTKKPRHKKRSEHNGDTHIAHLLANDLRRGTGITFDIPESADVDFKVYDHVFSMEHGDNMQFNGTSEIGSLGPVKRGNLRKTKKRQEQGRAFKYGMYGHFHQYVPAASQGFIMNGSLKGYDEYASDGQFSPEPAQQAFMIVTPEHGITVQAPIFVSKRSEEGW